MENIDKNSVILDDIKHALDSARSISSLLESGRVIDAYRKAQSIKSKLISVLNVINPSELKNGIHQEKQSV